MYEEIAQKEFRDALKLLDSGDLTGLEQHLSTYPTLVSQRVLLEGPAYFRTPTLLAFIAENPVRNGRLPSNIVALATAILDSGARSNQLAMDEALMLVSSGRVPRECEVQVPLLNLLCGYGADPDTAMPAALAHGEFAAVEALLGRGAQMSLSVASAFGRLEDVREMLADASDQERRSAFALAAQFSHPEVVALYLDNHQDPDQYNPPGFHPHSTPLHQAAFAGHEVIVRLLVERGARLYQTDMLWNGTPSDWARHAGHSTIEQYLLKKQIGEQRS